MAVAIGRVMRTDVNGFPKLSPTAGLLGQKGLNGLLEFKDLCSLPPWSYTVHFTEHSVEKWEAKLRVLKRVNGPSQKTKTKGNKKTM